MLHHQVKTPMQPVVAHEPIEVVAINFTVLEKSSCGLINVLIMTDVFSKFTVAVPARNQSTQTLAKCLVKY